MGKTRGRKRCRRKAVPLFKRKTPMFFGQGMRLTYHDLKQIAGALNDKSRIFSDEVKSVLSKDLREAFDTTDSCNEMLLICSIFLKMENQNLDRLIQILNDVSDNPQSV